MNVVLLCKFECLKINMGFMAINKQNNGSLRWQLVYEVIGEPHVEGRGIHITFLCHRVHTSGDTSIQWAVGFRDPFANKKNVRWHPLSTRIKAW